MPHLAIQYSSPMNQKVDMHEFCQQLAQEIADIGLYPLGGIRVRAFAADDFAIADRHQQNNFVDMVFRIGQGRSEADKKRTGERLMTRAKQYFADELKSGYFMLSLEIVEIQADYSWKANGVHQRLKGISIHS